MCPLIGVLFIRGSAAGGLCTDSESIFSIFQFLLALGKATPGGGMQILCIPELKSHTGYSSLLSLSLHYSLTTGCRVSLA